MKVIFHSLFALFFATALNAHAIDGGGIYDHGNGGDICEKRFKTVRDDVSDWIMKGGSADLRLPAKISHKQYSHQMLEKIKTAKITCVERQIRVNGAEKTCKNFVKADGSLRIQCNRNQFMATSESDQYVLVHHEFAGLAGFEVNNGESSNYEISDQITGYLENQIIQKLVVKKSQNISNDPFDPASCLGPQMSFQEAGDRFSPGVENKTFAEFKIHSRVRLCNQLNTCKEWELVENTVKLYNRDRDHNGTYVNIPTNGRMTFVSSGEHVGVQLLTNFGNMHGQGIIMDCGRLKKFDGTCSLSALSRSGMQYIGETFGIIGAQCTRITFIQKRFINSSSMWLEQELIFMSKY